MGFILLPTNCHIIFSLNLLGTGLLYIMMNSSFMSVDHLVCQLDLNEMETHKVVTLSLRWLYQITLSASFEGRLKFWSNFPFDLPSVLWNLEGMFLLYSSDLVHFILLYMFCLCLSLDYLFFLRLLRQIRNSNIISFRYFYWKRDF